MKLKVLAASLIAMMTLLAVEHPLAAQPTTDAAHFEVPATDDGLPGAGPIRRSEKFNNLWQTRRSEWSTQVKQDQHAVVFLGDSITQGWGPTFKDYFGEMKVANRGIGGDTTRGMLIRLQEDVISLNPSAVVMLMGTNDLAENATAETITGNVKLIIAALKAHNPKMPIILCKVFPSSETKMRPAEKITQLNDHYAEAVHGDPQVVVMETWVLFADENGNAKQEEFPDLLHPNPAGYKKWAAALRPIFATYGLLETEPDDFQNEPGFVSLFNGHDLTGWGYRPTPPAKTKAKQPGKGKGKQPAKATTTPPAPPIVEKAVSFDGKKSTDDGRYAAINGRLVVTTPAEGRRIQQLWTTQEFPNDFILKLEFRATPYADSGVFIRSPQLQCRDFLLAGPYTDLQKYKPQEWNEMVVTVKGSVAHCVCNGEVLEAEFPVGETGGIGLEGDRGQMEYRRLRIKEMP